MRAHSVIFRTFSGTSKSLCRVSDRLTVAEEDRGVAFLQRHSSRGETGTRVQCKTGITLHTTTRTGTTLSAARRSRSESTLQWTKWAFSCISHIFRPRSQKRHPCSCRLGPPPEKASDARFWMKCIRQWHVSVPFGPRAASHPFVANNKTSFAFVFGHLLFCRSVFTKVEKKKFEHWNVSPLVNGSTAAWE